MLGQRLRQLRIERGLRLLDIANVIGVTLRAIQNYESGIREPSLATLVKLADFFDVSTDYLLGRNDY